LFTVAWRSHARAVKRTFTCGARVSAMTSSSSTSFPARHCQPLVSIIGTCYPRHIVGLLDDARAADPALDAELDQLTAEQLAAVEHELALRDRAERLASAIGLDTDEVYGQLKHLERSPTERLRLGLNLGRRRRRISR
jgi:hypothetical protein